MHDIWQTDMNIYKWVNTSSIVDLSCLVTVKEPFIFVTMLRIFPIYLYYKFMWTFLLLILNIIRGQQTETVALINSLNPVNRLRLLSQSTAWIHSSDWDCCRSQQTESIQQTETVASVNKLWLMPRSTDWIQLTEWDCCPSQQTETTVHVNSLLTTGLSDHSIAWAVTLMFSQ